MDEKKYEYYTNGVWPIRATVLKDGTLIGVETPDEDSGQMQRNSYWFGKILENKSGEIDQITKETFDEMVKDFVAQKKTDPDLPPDVAGMG